MSVQRIIPPPSNLSTPAAQALNDYYRIWSDPPEEAGKPINWEQRLSLYAKIFAKDALLYFPNAAFVVSPEMPQSPVPTYFQGYESAIQYYTPFISAGCEIIGSSDISIQPFIDTNDFAFGQGKMIYELALPDGEKYQYQQEYVSQCRVNREGLIVEYEEKWNPIATLNLMKAFGAAAAKVAANSN